MKLNFIEPGIKALFEQNNILGMKEYVQQLALYDKDTMGFKIDFIFLFTMPSWDIQLIPLFQ